MLLISILLAPLVVALLCLLARPRGLVESLNIAGFLSVLVLGVQLFQTVLTNDGKVVTAWDVGADAVKVFPCSAVGGASYLRALKAPLLSFFASAGTGFLCAFMAATTRKPSLRQATWAPSIIGCG